MKKMTAFFLMLNLMLTLNLLSQEDLGYTTLECTLRPIERKPHSIYHAPNQSPFQVPLIEGAHSTSLNWSGYAAITGTSHQLDPTYGSVTQVSGCWVVPALTTSHSGDTFSSAWVGIDGYVNSVVEQIGTEHDVINKIPSYFAWFNLFPQSTQLIEGFPVNPGDLIQGKVVYRGKDDCGNDIFRLTIKNHTQKVKFSTIQHTLPGNPAHLSSAEWIVEAPGIVDPRIDCLGLAFLPLAHFHKIFFCNCKTIIDGKVGGIKDKHWTFDAITMTHDSHVKAAPSKLHEKSKSCSCGSSEPLGNSFKVSWENSGKFPFEVFCPPIVP